MPITSDEELEAQKLVESGEIDQAIAVCQRLKSNNGRMLHLAGVLYAEKKGDHYSAIDSFQEALQIQEEVFSEIFILNVTSKTRVFFLEWCGH